MMFLNREKRPHFQCLSPSDHSNNFQVITTPERAVMEFGGGDGFAIVFNHDALGEKFLSDKKGLQSAGKRHRYFVAVGNNILIRSNSHGNGGGSYWFK